MTLTAKGWRRLQRRVFARDAHTCRYCGKRPPEISLHLDHVIPRAHHGPDHESNLVTSCQTCNQAKSRTEGFLLNRDGLFYKNMLVAPGALQGDTLWKIVRRDRLIRQANDGLLWAKLRLRVGLV